MTDRIEEIKTRLQAATPRPWYVDEGWQDSRIYSEAKGADGDPQMTIYDEGGHSVEDAVFIAHAPEDITYLLERLEESEALIGLAKEVMGWCSHSQRCALTVTDYEQGIECTCGLRDALDALAKRAEERKMKDGPVCIACGLLGSDPIHFDAHGNGAKGDHRFRPAPSHTIAQRIFRDEFKAYREMATATENRLKVIIEEQQAATRESEALIEKLETVTEAVRSMDHARDCRGGEQQGPPGIGGREVWGICNCAKAALDALAKREGKDGT